MKVRGRGVGEGDGELGSCHSTQVAGAGLTVWELSGSENPPGESLEERVPGCIVGRVTAGQQEQEQV